MTFILPPEMPTQEGGKGVLYDFNDGARVLLPKGEWHVNIIDEESGNTLFSCDTQAGWVSSREEILCKISYTSIQKRRGHPFSG